MTVSDLILVGLALWKIVDIAFWICSHLRII